MITIVLIIAVAIIAVLTAYGWWKTNERIKYEGECRIADNKLFGETIDKVDKLSMQTIPMIMHKLTEFDNEFTEIKETIEDITDYIKRINGKLNRANDGINSLTNQYNCEVDDIKSKIMDIEDFRLKCLNALPNSVNDKIKILTSRLDDIGYQVESIDNARKANLKDLKELIEARHDYLRDRLLTHCHAYNVENNTLYIQNPLWIDNTKEPKEIEKNEEG